MSEDELRDKREMYHEAVHEERCFSSEDVRRLTLIENELSARTAPTID